MDKNVIKEIEQEHRGGIYKFLFGVMARNVETDSEHRFLSDTMLREIRENIKPGGTINGKTVTFTQAATRMELESGDTASTLFGKAKKWFNDLRSAAFCDVTERLDTTATGTVLDGRVGKAINDKFGGLSFCEEGGVKYVIGSDGVKKKLGSIPQPEWTVVAEEWYGDNSGVPGQHNGSQGNFVGKYGGYILEHAANSTHYMLAKDYDVKTLRADYTQLAADNFVCAVTSFMYSNVNEGWDDGGREDMDGPSVHAYNPETGTLTVKAGYLFSSGPNHGYCGAIKAKIMICG